MISLENQLQLSKTKYILFAIVMKMLSKDLEFYTSFVDRLALMNWSFPLVAGITTHLTLMLMLALTSTSYNCPLVVLTSP